MPAPMYYPGERNPRGPSAYRLMGNDENALSFALGHLLALDASFMLACLKQMGVLPRIQGRRYTELSNYQVYLQEQKGWGPSGRRDIVIEAGDPAGMRIVIEAKIGKGQPDSCQLLRYSVGCHCGQHPKENPKRIAQMWGAHRNKHLVALTRDPLDADVHDQVSEKLEGSGIELHSIQWHSILELALQRMRQPHDDPRQTIFLEEFVEFFKEHYEMNTYQAEVMVKKDDLLNATEVYMDGYMYVGGGKDIESPLYFAPYFTKQCAGKVPGVVEAGISCISRVIKVRSALSSVLKANPETVADAWIRSHDHWGHWQRGLQAIGRRARNEKWPDRWMLRLYFLSEPVKLNREHPVKGPYQIPAGYKTTVFDLLKKDTLIREPSK